MSEWLEYTRIQTDANNNRWVREIDALRLVDQLQSDRQILLEALENLQNKTDVYQQVYPDDKQLRKFKEIAREAIAKVTG